jgi:hypothetical protein
LFHAGGRRECSQRDRHSKNIVSYIHINLNYKNFPEQVPTISTDPN